MQKAIVNGLNGGRSHHVASSASSASGSGSGSSKHVRCIGRYVLTGTNLGKGNFARVEAAVHTLTRSKVAIKIIETDKIREEYVRKNLLREAQLMRRLRHPNIIRLYETMKTSNLYCLVMEVAEGGELLSHVRNDFKEKRLSEATTRPFIRQLVSALHHLHSAGIVHRDLKMENIMLDRKKRQVKIVDFGLSNAQAPGSLLQTHCGSPEYAAPELFIPGREYGPEVDVWSLGVNMYAMLVGKLPFRSPRQGSKKRQKLLEQIQAGLTENREKDTSHVTPEGRDLIGKLLQPNSQERIKLTEVMNHAWITKDGAHPLHPYKYTLPDQATQKSVMELMSSFLEVSQSEIKEAVRRDRCDWMAAIYNLLIDQPDGRVVMQRLLSAGPEEALVDAAHYQGAMEHFRLSQDPALQPETTPPEVAQALTAAVAGGTHSRAGNRHSIAGDPRNNYPSSTLPLPRHEKRRHHDNTSSPQQQPQSLGPVQPPLRRMSIGGGQIVPSYPHEKTPGLNQPLPPSHLPPSGRGGRKLPPTPSEAPYQPHPLPPQDSAHHSHHHTGRPHSRAESEPNPLPLPWRPSLVQKYQLSRDENEGAPHTKPINTSSPSRHHTFAEGGSSNHGNPTHLISPLSQMGGASSSTKKLKRNKLSYGERLLRPVRPISTSGELNKRISASVDTNLDIMRGGGQDYATPLLVGRLDGDARGQVGPRVDHTHTQPHAGWANYRVGSLTRRSRDIQALMQMHQPITSPYSSVQDISVIGGLDGGGGGGGKGSITSVDIKSELFSGGRGGGKGGEAWGHDGTRISPYASRVGSGYANRRVSPHGCTGTSPFGSTTVSPHGSRAVSPRQSAVISPLPDPAGAKVISPSHSRVIGRPVENLGEFPKSKRRHHHRSISANPATKPPSLDYYSQVNGLDHAGIPNGEHPPHRNRHGYVKPPHHLLPVANDSSEGRRSSAGRIETTPTQEREINIQKGNLI